MNKKINFLALMIAGLIFLQAGVVLAQSGKNKINHGAESNPVEKAGFDDEEKGIEGSWTATVTPTGADPFQALLTFDRGGGVIGSAQGDILLNPPPGIAPGATAVHGAWKKSGNKYFFTVKQIIYGADGSFQGGNKVRNSVSLKPNGNKLSGQYQFEITDANGNIVFSGTGTIQAVRIHVEPLTP